LRPHLQRGRGRVAGVGQGQGEDRAVTLEPEGGEAFVLEAAPDLAERALGLRGEVVDFLAVEGDSTGPAPGL